MKNSSRLPSPALILAVVALVLALTGSAVAAKRYLITNTKQISPVVLKQLAKLAAVQGAQGPTGAPGAAGTAGATGKDGAAGPTGAAGAEGATGKEGAPGKEGPRSDVLWAVVEPGGVVARASESGVTAEEDTPGFSIVKFANHPEPITDCAYEATIGLGSQSQTAFPGFVNVVRLSSDDHSVYVQTYDPETNSVPLGYHLAVFC